MKYDANLLQNMDKNSAEKITNEISNLYGNLILKLINVGLMVTL